MALIFDGLGVGAGRDASEYDGEPIAALLPATAPKCEPMPAERLDRFIDKQMKLGAAGRTDAEGVRDGDDPPRGLRSIKRSGRKAGASLRERRRSISQDSAAKCCTMKCIER